ncbi:hypothetical protein DAPPUDRAFT_241334 [Daphnia pulex]|uniref:Uncharacterized protein n=1 Tax=Daphnia pulex TaxID=6669 RepID=E9GE04_DAPPU|nr:hypothetical protein DAPPUDRAFT_241334 [Daphnia pulex]|eukprot:EFX82185.1 hypothetical protein DAPPUDRAFT_241334 [Daphnia pulex]
MTIIAMQFTVMLILGIFFPAFAWIGFKLADFFERKTKWGPVANQPDVHHLMATVPEGKVDQLEKDDRFNKREIDRYEKQFQNLCAVTTNVEETQTDNEKLDQGFQETAFESERDRHITESQLQQENNNLKKALVSLQEKNQRMAEAHQSDPPSVPIANNSAADECVTENQLSTLQFRIEKLEKEKVLHSETALKWEDTESQLRKEIADLENVVRNHKKALSIKVFEVDSLVQENELLTQNLDSVTTNLEIQLNKLSHLDPELSDEQFATSFPLEIQNEEAKQEAIMWRTRFEALQSENRKMWEIREDTLRSGHKAKKLADEQLAALAEALTALQQAIPDAKKGAAEAEAKVGGTWGKFKSSSSYGRDYWYDRWVKKKTGIQPLSREELEFIKLLQSTGSQLYERATILQEHAENLKEKSKDLKRRAKQLSGS